MKKGAMGMMVWTAKLDRRKLGILLGAVLLLCGTAGGLFLRGQFTQASSPADPKGVKTAEDRVAYLQKWGWVVPDEAAGVEELELPETFGSEYDDYLALQSGQGFDLTKYAGKRIKRYTYDVLNYPGGVKAQAHLLLYKNRVVGGEIFGEGFLHGLEPPQ